MSTLRPLFTAALLLGCAAPLHAQDLYVFGGWSQFWRDPPYFLTFAKPTEPPASPVQTVIAGVGLWVARDLAVEGSIGLHQQQAVDWQWRYLFAAGNASNQRTFDRDVPLVATLRAAPLRRHRVSIEPVLSGGISFHRSQSYITADCGPVTRPTTCVPVEPPKQGETFGTAEWLLGFGADVVIRASRRVAIMPGLRFMFINRREYLTGYGHRGPKIGGNGLPGFGVSVRYEIQDR